MGPQLLALLGLTCVLEAAFIADHRVITTTVQTSHGNECPRTCLCNEDTLIMVCTTYYKAFSFGEEPDNYTMESLSLFGGLTDIPVEIQDLPGLITLDLSRNSLQIVKFLKMKNPELLRKLDLSSNDINVVNSYAFVQLTQLTELDLSGNKISNLNSDVFSKLSSLEVLSLRFNKITGLPKDIFANLKNLEVLDLSNNHINHIVEDTFAGLTSLKSLHFNDNRLWKLSEETVSEVENVRAISLFGNPWDCSCELKPLYDLVRDHSTQVQIPGMVKCQTPEDYSGVAIVTINQSKLPCTEPNVSFISEAQNILVRSEVSLHCEVQGNPLPLTYWITPWGSVFAHQSFHTLLKKQNITASSEKYYESTIFTEGTPRVDVSEDGDLHFDVFMGSFHGVYTCFALNSAGEANATVNVTIHSAMPSVKISSILISGLCAGGFLAIGLIVGAIKVCALRICKCSCVVTKEDNYKTDSDIETVLEDEESTDALSERSCLESERYSEPPSVPVNSPVAQTPRASPMKCETPSVEAGERSNGSYINETLTEVKLRLEKKMEKVRSRVHSIRNSGSQYLTSIKDTGSQAANRVKAGVVLGVEQVKSSYLSMKEFCGTGDMNTHTISAVSISEQDNDTSVTVVEETTRV